MAIGEVERAPGAVAAAPVIPAEAPPNEGLTLKTRKGQTLLLGFTTAHFSHHVTNSILNPLLPFIRDYFALSYSQSGWLVSAYSMSLGFSNAPIGILADRYGARLVVVLGLVLTGLICAAVAFSGSYWQLLTLLILLGLVCGSYHAPASALMARLFPASVRGTAIGLHVMGGHLSFFVAPAMAAWLVSQTGSWTTPYLWLSFAPILASVWVWHLAPSQREPRIASTDRLAVFRDLGGVFQLVGPLISVSIVFQVMQSALIAFTTLYLVDVRGIEPAWAAVLFGVPQLVGLLGSPVAGVLSDRIGRRTVILIAMAMLGPAFLSLTLVPDEIILLPLILQGISASMRGTSTEVLVLDTAPPHRRSAALGTYHMLTQQSGGLAAPALGILAGAVGIGAAFSGVTIALGAASLLVVALSRKL